MIRLKREHVAVAREIFSDFEWSIVSEQMSIKSVKIKQKEESKVDSIFP